MVFRGSIHPTCSSICRDMTSFCCVSLLTSFPNKIPGQNHPPLGSTRVATVPRGLRLAGLPRVPVALPSGAPGGRPPLHHLPGAGRDSGYQPSSLLLPQKAPRLSLPSPQQPGFCLCHGMACRPEPSVLQFQNPALVIWFPREGSASPLSPVWCPYGPPCSFSLDTSPLLGHPHT